MDVRIGTNNVEENKTFYVQRVFATHVAIFDIIEEKITLNFNFSASIQCEYQISQM
jgi:hypothetical protein